MKFKKTRSIRLISLIACLKCQKFFATLRKAENGKVMKPGQSDDITDNMFQVPNNIVFATLRKAENRKDYITVNNSLFSRQGFLRD